MNKLEIRVSRLLDLIKISAPNFLIKKELILVMQSFSELWQE